MSLISWAYEEEGTIRDMRFPLLMVAVVLFAFVPNVGLTAQQSQQVAPTVRFVVCDFGGGRNSEDLLGSLLEILSGSSLVSGQVRRELINQLTRHRRFEVYSPQDLERLLRQNPDLARGQSKQLAEATGTRYLISGSVSAPALRDQKGVFRELTQTVSGNFQVVDMESGRVVLSRTYNGSDRKVIMGRDQEQLAYQITQQDRDMLMQNAVNRTVLAFMNDLNRQTFEAVGSAMNPPAETIPVTRLVVQGLDGIAASREFQGLVEQVAGVTKVEREGYADGKLTLSLTLRTGLAVDKFAEDLESAPALREAGYRVRVVEETASRIVIQIERAF